MSRAFPRSAYAEENPVGIADELCIGCYTQNGAIVPDLSPQLETENCPQNVYAAFYAESAGKYVLCADDGIYYSSGKEFVKSNAEYTPERPFCFEVGGATPGWYLAGGNKCLLVTEHTHNMIDLNYAIFGGVDKNGRLFCADVNDKSIIRWSGGNGGADWQESISGAGWLYVNRALGNILNLAVFKQRVAVVCEYGLALLSAYGAPENFKLTYTDGKTGKIIADTCAVAGGNLLFFTEEGLFSYNGAAVTKLEISLADDVVNPHGAIAYSGRYFVLGESKRLQRRAVFVFSEDGRCGYIVDLPATALCVHGQVMCFAPQGVYALAEGGEFTYKSGKLHFGTAGRKCLKSIHLGNCAPVEITVESGGKSRILSGVSGYCRPCLRGSSFEITLKSAGKITGLKAIAEDVNDV